MGRDSTGYFFIFVWLKALIYAPKHFEIFSPNVRDFAVHKKTTFPASLQNLTIVFPLKHGKAYNFGFEV